MNHYGWNFVHISGAFLTFNGRSLSLTFLGGWLVTTLTVPNFCRLRLPSFLQLCIAKDPTSTENKIYFNFFCLGNWKIYVVSHFWLSSVHFVFWWGLLLFKEEKCTENSKSGRSDIWNYCSSSKMIMRIKIGYHISCSIIDYS